MRAVLYDETGLVVEVLDGAEAFINKHAATMGFSVLEIGAAERLPANARVENDRLIEVTSAKPADQPKVLARREMPHPFFSDPEQWIEDNVKTLADVKAVLKLLAKRRSS